MKSRRNELRVQYTSTIIDHRYEDVRHDDDRERREKEQSLVTVMVQNVFLVIQQVAKIEVLERKDTAAGL